MNKSKSEQIKKWLSRIGWLVGFLSKFAPANIKSIMLVVSTIIGASVTMLDKCDSPKPESTPIIQTPAPSPTLTPTPEPTPTPTPKPTRPPLPELKVPRYVKSGEKFRVELCHVGNRYDVSLFAEENRLGYIGFGKPCMVVNIALNQKGKRELMAIGPDNLRVFADVIVE